MSSPEDEDYDDLTSTQITERLFREVRPFLQPGKLKEAEHQIETVVVQQLHQEFHQGPLPTPRYLTQYDEALPGAAERIMAMAEAEQSHRHVCEGKIIGTEVILKTAGQFLAFASLVLMMVLLGYMTYLGAAASAATLGAVMVTGVVGLFLAPKFFQQQAPPPQKPTPAKPRPKRKR